MVLVLMILKRILEITEANMLVLHLNSIQEIIQTEGNTNFNSLLSKIEQVCRELKVPVGVKEIGWGLMVKQRKD